MVAIRYRFVDPSKFGKICLRGGTDIPALQQEVLNYHGNLVGLSGIK